MQPSKEEIIRLGLSAQLLLENPTFVAVMNEIATGLAIRWAATKPGEIKQREDMHLLLQGINSVRDELRYRVEAKVKAESDVARAERRKKEI